MAGKEKLPLGVPARPFQLLPLPLLIHCCPSNAMGQHSELGRPGLCCESLRDPSESSGPTPQGNLKCLTPMDQCTQVPAPLPCTGEANSSLPALLSI